MRKSTYSLVGALAAMAITMSACAPDVAEPNPATAALSDGPSFARASNRDATFAWVAEQVDQFNANLEAAGSSIRLDYPWMFVVGPGTDPFGRLRTGARWPMETVGYILDESDYTTDIPFAEVDATLVTAYDIWNDIPNTFLEAIRDPDTGGNFDVLDGLFDAGGNCVFLFDLTSPNLDFGAGLVFPEDDIVVGGWVNPNYFSQCLGSVNIIAVTWTFSDVDMNGDNYRDRQYVEQFYNPAFTWVTSGSVFLDGTSGVDLATIAGHENGHAHGLGHFGGPINRQPFTLKPNGRVFNPEAIMNPFYLFGEKRDLEPTDVAGLRTMYARGK